MARHRRPIVLVVDDDAAIRKLARVVLSEHGFTVLEASDGAQALEMLHARQSRIDLAILDLVMPNMGGLDVANRLDGTAHAPKILYISGMEHSVAVDSLERSAPKQMLRKPFSAEQLLSRVRAVMGGAGE
jgi:DNA-binding response OmpR family regulator